MPMPAALLQAKESGSPICLDASATTFLCCLHVDAVQLAPGTKELEGAEVVCRWCVHNEHITSSTPFQLCATRSTLQYSSFVVSSAAPGKEPSLVIRMSMALLPKNGPKFQDVASAYLNLNGFGDGGGFKAGEVSLKDKGKAIAIVSLRTASAPRWTLTAPVIPQQEAYFVDASQDAQAADWHNRLLGKANPKESASTERTLSLWNDHARAGFELDEFLVSERATGSMQSPTSPSIPQGLAPRARARAQEAPLSPLCDTAEPCMVVPDKLHDTGSAPEEHRDHDIPMMLPGRGFRKLPEAKRRAQGPREDDGQGEGSSLSSAFLHGLVWLVGMEDDTGQCGCSTAQSVRMSRMEGDSGEYVEAGPQDPAR